MNYQYDKDIYSNRLRQAMNDKEITQVELSKLIEKSKSSINEYISGVSIPRIETQKRIANVLGKEIDWFFQEIYEEAKEESYCNYYKPKKISIKDAATMLGKSEHFVKLGLQQGRSPIGHAVKGIGKKWIYHISPKKLEQYIGKMK